MVPLFSYPCFLSFWFPRVSCTWSTCISHAGPYFIGYPRTPYSIARAHQAMPNHSVRFWDGCSQGRRFIGITPPPWIPDAIRACTVHTWLLCGILSWNLTLVWIYADRIPIIPNSISLVFVYVCGSDFPRFSSLFLAESLIINCVWFNFPILLVFSFFCLVFFLVSCS
jgi:hypothetical protein